MSRDKKELEEHLDRCSTAVQRNTVVVTPEDLVAALSPVDKAYDGSYHLHISTNTEIKQFVPRLTLRGDPSENRDITRIYVAPTLLGCIIGYANMENDFMSYRADGKESDYKGGYKIYELPCQASLKPNKRMVLDQDASDEHWMVTYSPETITYTPKNAGRFYIEEMHYTGRTGKLPAGEITIMVEVKKEEGFPFSKNHYLKKGFYRITGPVARNTQSWKHDRAFMVEEISRSDFTTNKGLRAALLSHQEPNDVPAYAQW